MLLVEVFTAKFGVPMRAEATWRGLAGTCAVYWQNDQFRMARQQNILTNTLLQWQAVTFRSWSSFVSTRDGGSGRGGVDLRC
jgi:hypothetical protein